MEISPKIQPMGPPDGNLAKILGSTAAATLLVGLVAVFEGKRNDPYLDIVKVQTVCYGETNVAMHHYSDAQCRAMLSDSLAGYAKPVLQRNPELAGHDNQIAAATSLAYNIGAANYRKSRVARNFSAGRWHSACDAFLSWDMSGGKHIPGLLKRRRAERDLCLKDML